MTFATELSRVYLLPISLPRLAALTGVFSLGLLFGQGAGTVSGRVTDASGKAVITNAEVYLHGKNRVFLGKTVSTAAGAYRFEAVADGEYELCATPTGGDAAKFLNSCIWDRVSRPVTVQQSGRAASTDIPLRSAATFQVQVADPLALLDVASGAGQSAKAQPALHVRLWTREYTQFPMTLKNAAKNMRTFEALVPFDTEILIGFEGTPLQIDLEGSRVSTKDGNARSIRVDSSKETSKSLAVSIVGGAQ